MPTITKYETPVTGKDSLTVTITIKNTGNADFDQLNVQVTGMNDIKSNWFEKLQRISLKAGEQKTLTFYFSPSELLPCADYKDVQDVQAATGFTYTPHPNYNLYVECWDNAGFDVTYDTGWIVQVILDWRHR
jgi:hypothetical protein